MIERRQRTMFRATRAVPAIVYDPETGDADIVGTRQQTRWFARKADACRWIAVGFILRMRARTQGLHCFARESDCPDCKESRAVANEIMDSVHAYACCEWHDAVPPLERT